MSNRYTRIPNPNTDRDPNNELEAAFDDSGDEFEEDDIQNTSESHPLNPTSTDVASPVHTSPRIPGAYDFENVDYDYPPPGSPPHPSAIALPNSFGNSNGFIPVNTEGTPPARRRGGWFNRTASSILPTHYVRRFGFGRQQQGGAVGGGIGNDGVFANVTAKPTRPVRIQEDDESYLVPEETRQEAPPSYSHAQADAVPPYWETTVHAPFASDALGEMIIDALPTGSLFSFMWNMLVSISFQFVGFLLTYLLHTTHAARLGSRAGLGVTLIQYGFALRAKADTVSGEGEATWSMWKSNAQLSDTAPQFGTAAEAEEYYAQLSANSTTPTPTIYSPQESSMLMADATTEWLSFFLMTAGWFILLTSLLGFWRVKRWEHGIISSQQRESVSEANSHSRIVSSLEAAFPGILASRNGDILRRGLGLAIPHEQVQNEEEAIPPRQFEEEVAELNEEESEVVSQALANELRLREDLRAAGLL